MVSTSSLFREISTWEVLTGKIHLHHSIANDPVIDKPGPSPCEERLDNGNCDHELAGEFFVGI